MMRCARWGIERFTLRLGSRVSDRADAERRGVYYSSKISKGTLAVQKVGMIEGRVEFLGSVDFAPERVVVPSATVLSDMRPVLVSWFQDLADDAPLAASLTNVCLIISLAFIPLDARSLE